MYTGMAPIFFNARRSLVNGLIWGLGADLILIVVAITISMRHWSNGLLLLLTSFFPVILVLGAAGWLGITLDQGAVLAPCVALGVSVDDVIHFLICFRYAMAQGQRQQQAVWLAWRSCGRPMYQSWTLLGLGMATLGVSAFIPIVQFGWTMVAMLTVGLLGNLLLLPALLSGPLGRTIAKAALGRR
jgi:predicted RND superfamily exporter protein